MKKTDLKQLVNSDLRRYGISSLKELSFMDRKELYGFLYTSILRKTAYYKEHNKLLFCFYRIKLHNLSEKLGISIPYSAKIGYGFYIGHKGNIIVNGNAIIGDNVNISQGVTIGYSNGKNKGTPRIGNNVFIGSNSVIVGNITIGNDVVIAPNTFVNFDVPDHSIVIFEKAKVISRIDAANNFVENCYE